MANLNRLKKGSCQSDQTISDQVTWLSGGAPPHIFPACSRALRRQCCICATFPHRFWRLATSPQFAARPKPRQRGRPSSPSNASRPASLTTQRLSSLLITSPLLWRVPWFSVTGAPGDSDGHPGTLGCQRPALGRFHSFARHRAFERTALRRGHFFH